MNKLINDLGGARSTAGSCNDFEEFITLSWPSKKSNKLNNLTLTFFWNGITDDYILSSIEANLAGEDLHNYDKGKSQIFYRIFKNVQKYYFKKFY